MEVGDRVYKKAAMCRDVIVPHVTIEDPRVTVCTVCTGTGSHMQLLFF